MNAIDRQHLHEISQQAEKTRNAQVLKLVKAGTPLKEARAIIYKDVHDRKVASRLKIASLKHTHSTSQP